jgi:hypothetical protein
VNATGTAVHDVFRVAGATSRSSNRLLGNYFLSNIVERRCRDDLASKPYSIAWRYSVVSRGAIELYSVSELILFSAMPRERDSQS